MKPTSSIVSPRVDIRYSPVAKAAAQSSASARWWIGPWSSAQRAWRPSARVSTGRSTSWRLEGHRDAGAVSDRADERADDRDVGRVDVGDRHGDGRAVARSCSPRSAGRRRDVAAAPAAPDMSVVTAAARAPSRAASSTAISSRIATATWTMPAPPRRRSAAPWRTPPRLDRRRCGPLHRYVGCDPRADSDAFDRAVDHLVEQAGDAFGSASGGRPGDHEQTDERRGEQDERILGRGLTVVAEPTGSGAARGGTGRSTRSPRPADG